VVAKRVVVSSLRVTEVEISSETGVAPAVATEGVSTAVVVVS
jgi:hypothetical protein